MLGLYLSLIWFLSLATVPPLLGQSEDLVLQANASEESVALNWFPTDSMVFMNQLKAGYSIIRTKVDTSGRALGAPIVLARRVLPREESWFMDNGDREDGLLKAVGALLYDSAYVFVDNNIINEAEMKYNFIVYEATGSPLVASATGLGMVDTTVVPGQFYRYELSALNTTFKQQLVIKVAQGASMQQPANYSPNFEFPNKKSLSDMRYERFRPENLAIRLIGKAYGDSIVLRWGLTSPKLWEIAKRRSFKVYKMGPDGQVTALSEVEPWKKAQITEKLEEIRKDSLALMAAALLHDGVKSARPKPGATLEGARKFQNFFGLTLFAADQSRLAAELLGLRFTDTEVQGDEQYAYWVTLDTLDQEIAEGFAVIKNTFRPNKAPAGFRLEPGDGQLRLRWDKVGYNKAFSAYRLERSLDGQQFEPITDGLLVFGEDSRIPLEEYSIIDSTGDNDQQFYYRLSGRNAFAEWSPYAEVKGKGVDLTPPPAVSIREGVYLEDNHRLSINWEIPEDMPADFDHFQVFMSDHPSGAYSAVSPFLAAAQDSFVMDLGKMDTDRGFYLKVASVDRRGNYTYSIYRSVIVPDRTAPDPPAVLTGSIDSTGRVEVVWQPSEAGDVRGYWLYWGHQADELMVKPHERIITENSYSWNIPANSLNETLYVSVRAQDDSYNLGEVSDLLVLKRPDKVPPVAPTAEYAETTDEGIELVWIPSNSQDVVHQLIFRRVRDKFDRPFELLDTLPAEQGRYLDTEVKIDGGYDYYIQAVDEVGNISRPSENRIGRFPFKPEMAVVTCLETNTINEGELIEGQLSWHFLPIIDRLDNYPYTFEIYRSTGSTQPKIYGRQSGKERDYVDQNLEPGILYNYAVRVRFENGWLGAWSEIKSLMIE